MKRVNMIVSHLGLNDHQDLPNLPIVPPTNVVLHERVRVSARDAGFESIWGKGDEGVFSCLGGDPRIFHICLEHRWSVRLLAIGRSCS